MISLIKKQWFVIGLFVAVLFAFQFPEVGANGGPLRPEITTNLAIILVFLIQGWMLPTEVLAKGMLRMRAHVFTQLFIFFLFPMVIVLGDLFWGEFMSTPLRYGFFFLGALPTTVTSAIIYTSQSNGSVPVSLINTTVSNMVGILITPIWMLLLTIAGGGEMGDLSAVLLKLSKLILAPLVIGQICHILWKDLVKHLKGFFGYFNQSVIIFIVLAVFSNSVVGGAWVGQGRSIILMTLGLCVVLFLILTVICGGLLFLTKIPRDEQVAVYFCSTQKTLAAGIPLGISLFGSDPSFGVILLPVMLFHPVQLILGAFLIVPLRKYQSEGAS
ncbi:bile acid:sodium symporter [Opitutia bacterium ISCC 51]|nr:bile acid:sodium symporter [Opitutae bacterium ISCC 51]QXD27021.1 bile acid:sodium symporter [Opitutae bacterium ISCC 52]